MHVKDFAYISNSFFSSNAKLDYFFHNHANKNLVIDSWAIDNIFKHYINSWVAQKLEDYGLMDVVEVGGGISYFTNFLSRRSQYVNLDFLAHFSHHEKMYMEENDIKVLPKDWRDFDFKNTDTCIVLDIFPNVDQGLRTFLKNVRNVRNIFISFTVFENEKFYKAKRVEGDEMLTQVSWTLEQLKFNVGEFIDNVEILQKDCLLKSPFSNSRDVFLVHLQND